MTKRECDRCESRNIGQSYFIVSVAQVNKDSVHNHHIFTVCPTCYDDVYDNLQGLDIDKEEGEDDEDNEACEVLSEIIKEVIDERKTWVEGCKCDCHFCSRLNQKVRRLQKIYNFNLEPEIKKGEQ